MHAALRWIRADLRARRGQALITVGVLAGAVLVLLVGLSLLEGAIDPWRGVFARSNGAHIWIHTAPCSSSRPAGPPDSSRPAELPCTDLQPLARLDGVTAIAGPYQTAAVVAVRDGRRTRAELRVMGPQPPEIARPLVTRGRWLSAGAPSGVVVERSYAADIGVRVGDRLTVQTLLGRTTAFTVTGIAETADQVPYPDAGQGIVWGLPPVLTALRTDPGGTQQLIGLRLADPSLTDFVAQRAATALPASQLESMTTWREVRSRMELDDRLAGSFLSSFGVAGLAGAVLAIGNAAGAWVLARRTDIALLKTLGLTPGGVTRLLLLEQGLLGLAGIVLGIVLGDLATGPWLLPVWAPAATVPSSSRDLALVVGAVTGVLLTATFIPAWRGGRVSAVAAASHPVPAGRLSRVARLALLMRLPPAVVLGLRDAFGRRSYAALTIVGLAVPMFMVTVGLGCQATLREFGRHPGRLGVSGALTVRGFGMTDERAAALARADPGVAAVYPAAYTEAFLPDDSRSVQVRAIGTAAAGYPYRVVAGRTYRAPGEAVAGQGLLTALHARVGQRVYLKIGDRPIVVRIVGRTLEPDRGGEVLSLGLDTLADFQSRTPPQFLSVVPRPGASPVAVRSRLLARSGGALDITVPADPLAHYAMVRTLLPLLVVLLTLIGMANMTTSIAVRLHDRLRDVAVLRAIGLTPRQVTVALTAGTSLLALVAALLGTAAGAAVGPWLIDLQGYGSGIGAGIGRPPSPAVQAPVVAAVLLLATLIAYVPARRASRTQAETALQERVAAL